MDEGGGMRGVECGEWDEGGGMRGGGMREVG